MSTQAGPEQIPTTPTTPTPTGIRGVWEKLLKALREILTGKDNQSHDLGHWSWILCTLAVMAHDYYQLTHGSPPNVKDLAIALATVAAAHGVALKLKETQEPGG